jgi:cytochrome c oxidase cbb3-type subunit 2
MSRSSILFAGLFGSFAVSCFALVLIPQSQLGMLEPQFTEEDGKYSDIYPVENPSVEKGRAIYASEGCVYCHSQQVRDPQSGTDIDRGWGTRRTVARDYLYATPPFLGTQRFGPDLANVGSPDWRNEPKDDVEGRPAKRDDAWEYLHLYSPRVIDPASNQPPYRYLFEVRKISGQGSADALKLTGEDALSDPTLEVVPTADAKSLVKYLRSLNRSTPLKEAAGPSASAAPAAAAAPAPAAATPPAPAK